MRAGCVIPTRREPHRFETRVRASYVISAQVAIHFSSMFDSVRMDSRLRGNDESKISPLLVMLLIPCPWCGPRNQIEFTYGGDATKRRPLPDAPESAWFDYVYLRDNPRGPHDELWHHGAGCRRWFKVRRDTRTHDILASAKPGEPSAGGAL